MVSKVTSNSVELNLVQASGVDFSDFVSEMEGLGVQPVAISQTYGAVDGLVPVSELGTIAQLTDVRSMSPILKFFLRREVRSTPGPKRAANEYSRN